MLKTALLLVITGIIVSCQFNSEPPVFTFSDSEITVGYGLEQGDTLLQLDVTVSEGGLNYEILSQDPQNAVSVTNTGFMLVSDESVFQPTESFEVFGIVRAFSGPHYQDISFTIRVLSSLQVADIETTILPNPAPGFVLGSIIIHDSRNVSYSILSESIPGSVGVTDAGRIVVENTASFPRNSVFDAFVGISDDILTDTIRITVTTINLWSGPDIEFEKVEQSDPDREENQDRITENVWITRANTGGEIYNAKSENGPTQFVSPEGTLWARGVKENIFSLTFDTFRNVVRPANVVNQDLILYIIDEEAYIPVRFTSWSSSGKNGQSGGVVYIRATED